MIDSDGYRFNVGIIICNAAGALLWCRRRGQEAWQFPQGGMKAQETPERAMYRELAEETGLLPAAVNVLAESKQWLRYEIPAHLVRHDRQPVCIGQKQRWFLLQLVSPETQIRLNSLNNPEFDAWRWVEYWQPVQDVVAFKRDVYRQALTEFEDAIKNFANNTAP
ncbi:MAG: RNA pyrophosphohydrolase [Gammaproteobacteria bacterium]|nr:RNA pyrophosphohydrolase [Gammaproteobacteria bacterium]